MKIKKIIIKNFKCFKGHFEFHMNEGINILVGDNEAGKSTILEAIHLSLSGLFHGKYFKTDFNQYVFNHEVLSEYLSSLSSNTPISPPSILIEVYLDAPNLPFFDGDGNSEKIAACGFRFEICFDQNYKAEYEAFIASGEIQSLPIEYYKYSWTTFARAAITPKFLPFKSALIDSSSNRFKNGSDVYIAKIVKDLLDQKEIISVSQAYRKMKDVFMTDDSIEQINKKIETAAQISDKDVKLSVEFSSMNAWESSLMTYLDQTPFHHIGKGEQCIIKTRLALSHKKTKEASIILLEEPENHLSHTKLNQLVRDIKNHSDDKQILISTHSSFVANKLGLESLILLNNQKITKLDDLTPDTKEYFSKLSGYDTLRLILCEKAILVEGDSDELIVQKAYMIRNGGKLPIEDGIEVISVGLSFLRFLELAEKLNKPVSVVTDSDGDIAALNKKYSNYLPPNQKPGIKICFDSVVDTGTLTIGEKSATKFNYNTLEPKILKANTRKVVNEILGKSYATDDELHIHMKSKKTDCALKFFNTKEDFNFPQYILDAL